MPTQSDKFSNLRIRAEALVHEHLRTDSAAAGKNDLELKRLLHEIEVHAVELELQNEELKKTRDQLEGIRDHYRDLYDFAPVAYFNLAENGLIQEANIAALKLLNLPREKVFRQGFLSFVLEDSRGIYLNSMRSVRHNDHLEPVVVQLQPRDKPAIHTQIDITKTTNKKETEAEFRLVVSDISERILLEQQRDMFFSVASHELRTPITNIALSLDLLLDTQSDELSPEVQERLRIAQRGTMRLRRLMEDILSLRSIKTGVLPLQIRPLDLQPLLHEAVELNNPSAQQHQISFNVRDYDAKAMVEGNEARLLQVLNNLLTNAIKHSPTGGRIDIWLEHLPYSYRVNVKDQGPGVPVSLGQQIFEPFTQHIPSLEDMRHKESKGLGLSIGREIIEKLSGHLNYINGADGGVTFYFDLPKRN